MGKIGYGRVSYKKKRELKLSIKIEDKILNVQSFATKIMQI